ncbi:MAG: S24/S26 family peptidase [Clostridia bacterium]|nr:S24/S26 family peptidase [Clostridia bacterium]
MEKQTFEEILESEGRLVYRTRGVSMRPLLKQDRDLICVEKKTGRAKKYDVILYKRGKNYVLHRVLGVRDGSYKVRGDNTYSDENVKEEDVLGIMTSFSRNGRQTGVDNTGYRFYSRAWRLTYPFRLGAVRARAMASAVKRRVTGKRNRDKEQGKLDE